MEEELIVKRVYEIIDKAKNREKAKQAEEWFTNGKGTPFSLLELGLSEGNVTDFITLRNAFMLDCLAYGLGEYEFIAHYLTEMAFIMNKYTNTASGGVKSVYVIEMENKTVKIGIANDTTRRFREIRAASGMKILRQWISKPTKRAFELERKVHKSLKDYRLNGEYFNISYEKAIKTILLQIDSDDWSVNGKSDLRHDRHSDKTF